jgi:hypothetical protein
MAGLIRGGGLPRTVGYAAALGLIVLGALTAGPYVATAQEIEIRGQLDYAALRQAEDRRQTVRVKYSPGGTGSSALALSRVSDLIIDGRCNSACAWAFVRNENACFTKQASFGFHASHDPGTGRRLNVATRYWLDFARPSLRARLANLLKNSRLIVLSAHGMRRYYGDRACDAPRQRPVTVARQTGFETVVIEAATVNEVSTYVTAAAPVKLADDRHLTTWRRAFNSAVVFETIALDPRDASSTVLPVRNLSEASSLLTEYRLAALRIVVPPMSADELRISSLYGSGVSLPVSGIMATAPLPGLAPPGRAASTGVVRLVQLAGASKGLCEVR